MAIRGGHRRGDQFDVSLVDAGLMEEVRLLIEFMEAASAVEERVDSGEIDRILGVMVPKQRRAVEVVPQRQTTAP